MKFRARLVIARNIAPRNYWHWCVIMESGHIIHIESFNSMWKCLASALTFGVLSWGKALKQL